MCSWPPAISFFCTVTDCAGYPLFIDSKVQSLLIAMNDMIIYAATFQFWLYMENLGISQSRFGQKLPQTFQSAFCPKRKQNSSNCEGFQSALCKTFTLFSWPRQTSLKRGVLLRTFHGRVRVEITYQNFKLFLQSRDYFLKNLVYSENAHILAIPTTLNPIQIKDNIATLTWHNYNYCYSSRLIVNEWLSTNWRPIFCANNSEIARGQTYELATKKCMALNL